VQKGKEEDPRGTKKACARSALYLWNLKLVLLLLFFGNGGSALVPQRETQNVDGRIFGIIKLGKSNLKGRKSDFDVQRILV